MNPVVLVFYCFYTNIHKLSGLNNTNLLFHSSGNRKADTSLTEGCSPSGGSKGESDSLLRAISRSCLHSFAWHPPPFSGKMG